MLWCFLHYDSANWNAWLQHSGFPRNNGSFHFRILVGFIYLMRQSILTLDIYFKGIFGCKVSDTSWHLQNVPFCVLCLNLYPVGNSGQLFPCSRKLHSDSHVLAFRTQRLATMLHIPSDSDLVMPLLFSPQRFFFSFPHWQEPSSGERPTKMEVFSFCCSGFSKNTHFSLRLSLNWDTTVLKLKVRKWKDSWFSLCDVKLVSTLYLIDNKTERFIRHVNTPACSLLLPNLTDHLFLHNRGQHTHTHTRGREADSQIWMNNTATPYTIKPVSLWSHASHHDNI